MTRSSLRVGIDARELLGHTTGVGRYLAELVARWTRDPGLADHELVLFSPRPLPSDAPWMGRGGATLTSVVAPGGTGTSWEQWHLARAARTQALSVFFAPAYTAPLWVDVPVVVSIHDVSFAAHPEWFPWKQALRRRVLARLGARRACRVLTLTRFSSREIASHLGVPESKISVVSPAVDAHPAFASIAPAPRPASARDPVALYVGSIFNRRHVPELVLAFADAVRRMPGARLEIVGENRTHPPQDPAGVVAQLGLGSHVSIRDYVDEPTLASLYDRARAFVFLSEYEGFGLTPLEAMARGVPAIVLDTDVAREAYGDAAIYVSRPDSPELGPALSRLLLDDEWHREKAEAGHVAAARYSWDRAAAETFAVIQGCAR